MEAQSSRYMGMTGDGSTPATGTLRIRALLRAVALSLGVVSFGAHADQSLPALNSYGQPPFVIAGADRPSGLASTFVELLNEAAGARPPFRLENLPRRRLELTLGNGAFAGVALFLAPEFVAAPVQQQGVWSVPVMVDENLIVSARPLKMSALEDLHGLKLGGIAGHIYRLLGPAIEQGKVEREDAADHVSNLQKLCLGRVDFVVISRSELAGTQPHVRCPQGFRPAAFPEPQVIVRRVLVRMPSDSDAREVLGAIAEVACGEPWSAALGKYGLSTVGCQHKALAKGGDVPPTAKPGKAARRAGERGGG